MKNLICLILVSLIGSINAQGITNTLGGNTADDKFVVENSDSETGMVVTGEGNVGIGTTNPLSKLSIGGDGTSNATIYGETTAGHNSAGVIGLATNTGAVTNYGGNFTAAGEYGNGVYGEASNSGENATNHGGYFRAHGKYGRGVYGQVMGSNGFGVFGDATHTGNVTNYGGYFKAAGENGFGVYGEASNSGAGTNYGGYFKANGAGGYGVHGIAPGNGGIGVYGKTTGNDGYGVLGKATEDYGKGVFGNAPGARAYGVFGSGGLYDFYAAGPGVNYGDPSSIRWKRNIVEIDNPLEKLAELRGVYFDWDEEHGGQRDVGCIGEEVGKVLPEIVVYEENGIDADGMDYSKLTPLLIEVAKAQQALIDELTKRIEELENR